MLSLSFYEIELSRMPNLQCLTKGTSTVLMGCISIIIDLEAIPRQPSVACSVRMIRKYVGTDLPGHDALISLWQPLLMGRIFWVWYIESVVLHMTHANVSIL